MTRNILSNKLYLLFAAMVFTACGGGGADSDSNLDRNLDMPGGSAGGQVSLDDNAPRKGGTSTPPAPSARTGRIAADAPIILASSSKVCTHTHKAGDTFSATVKDHVAGSNGAAIPSGSVATVEITSLKRPEKASERAEMGFRVKSITVGGKVYPVDSRITAIQTVQERSSRSKDAQKVIGGAVAGAIIGQIIGKDTKGTVIGAATGAAAGTVVAMATGEYEGCVPDGGNITIALNSALVLNIGQ